MVDQVSAAVLEFVGEVHDAGLARSFEGPLEWNATLIGGDAVTGVEKLKAEHDRDPVLIGRGDVARQLLEHGLIDELRFWVHPAMRGSGERSLEGEQSPLELLGSRTFDSDVTLRRYRPA